jgi:hypothetical protein
MTEPTSPLNRTAVALSAGVHVAHQLWPNVQEDERVRGVVFFGGRCLEALYRGDPRAAGEALHQMDNVRALIPNGDETNG